MLDWWFEIVVTLCSLWVFVVGLGVGSFLNVVIARLPYEKSIMWPGSRCFTCLQKLRLFDNVPIIGYLRLGGKCRNCGATFSSRYLWIELITGVLFVALFWIEILSQGTNGPAFVKPWHFAPGLQFSFSGNFAMPPLVDWVYFFCHAFLFSMLMAAALIDAEHQIIPAQLTYAGTIVGLIISTVFPWPWPTMDPMTLAQIPDNVPWILPQVMAHIPNGIMPWPCWGPTPSWAPPGTWQLGLLNGFVGAAFGMGLVRGIKFLFEVGMKREALGLGDADLLMMVGAFLGWQIVLVGFFLGAFAALLLKIPIILYDAVSGRAVASDLSFGPGLAIGVITAWIGWPWIGKTLVLFFDPIALGLMAFAIGGGLLAAGLLLRRR